MNEYCDTNRQETIKKLEELAEQVLKLKSEHRQKRPIVIEFSGSPKAGKTSCINSLVLFLRRNGFSVTVIQERASMCPVSDKQSPSFNMWTASMSLSGMIGVLENKSNHTDVLILDRGIFDAICWFQWLVNTGKMEKKQQQIAEDFFLMDETVKCIDIVFAFYVPPEISIEREYAHLLTNKNGSIMNKRVLHDYLKALNSTFETKQQYFHKIFRIDSSKKDQNDVGKEVTEITLIYLKELLMERIGYVKKEDHLMNSLSGRPVISFSNIKNYLPEIEFGLRQDIEKDNIALQPIPIAVLTNRNKDKVLIIKKNNRAVESDSPERDRILPYVGGHSRIEDKTDASSHDFLDICKAALKREVREEIGISVAVDDLIPDVVYTPCTNKSSNHLAVCFVIVLDDIDIKLRLDKQELITHKGTSLSGNFISVDEIPFNKLESWGIAIMNYYFKKTLPEKGEITEDPLVLFGYSGDSDIHYYS